MSQAVDDMIRRIHGADLSQAEREEFDIRVKRGELFGERGLSIITVKVETPADEDPTDLIQSLASQFAKCIEDEYVADAKDPRGWDGTLAVTYNIDTEVGY
jgi:hypothetical protein